MTTDEDDAALLRRYRKGDAEAFAALYARHRLGLYRFLCGLGGDVAQAEEVFQETWLYRIARNRLIDHWRRNGRRSAQHEAFDEQLHGEALPGEAEDPLRQLSLSRDRERLQQALEALPGEQREVFLLRAHGDLELQEIAELTRTPAETVKSRLRYALQKLRRLLADPAATQEVAP